MEIPFLLYYNFRLHLCRTANKRTDAVFLNLCLTAKYNRSGGLKAKNFN